jgi:hypothetical protein
MNNIRMMGRWNSDAMIKYLHVQAQPVMGDYAACAFNQGTYSFLPDETVLIVDVYGDDDLTQESYSCLPSHPTQGGAWSQMLAHAPLSQRVQHPGGKRPPL